MELYISDSQNLLTMVLCDPVHTSAENGGGGRSITLALAKSLSVAVSLSPKSELALPLDCLFSLRLGGIIIGAGAHAGGIFWGACHLFPSLSSQYLHNSV